MSGGPSRSEAERRATTFVGRWQERLPALATWLETSIADTLAVFAPRPVAGHRLKSTNGIEHDHMAVRRWTPVIRVFPNEASFVRIARERNEKWLAKRYVAAVEDVLRPGALMPAA